MNRAQRGRVDALSVLAAHNPVQPIDNVGDWGEGAELILAQILGAEVGSSSAYVARAPRTRRRRLVGAAGVFGVTAVAAITALTLLPSGSTLVGPSVAAAAVLQQAQHSAAVSPPLPVGDFLYTRENAVELQLVGCLLPGECQGSLQDRLNDASKPHGYTIPTVTDIWVSPTGTGRLHRVTGAPTFLPGDLTAFKHAGQPIPQSGVVVDAALGDPTVTGIPDPTGWPTTAPELEAAIEQRDEDGHAQPQATFGFATELLQVAVEPALRAAAYGVMMMLPGVTSDGPQIDSLGRSGQGLSMTYSGLKVSIVVDPGTGDLLAKRTVLVAPARSSVPLDRGLAAGTVISDETFSAPTIVASIAVG